MTAQEAEVRTRSLHRGAWVGIADSCSGWGSAWSAVIYLDQSGLPAPMIRVIAILIAAVGLVSSLFFLLAVMPHWEWTADEAHLSAVEMYGNAVWCEA